MSLTSTMRLYKGIGKPRYLVCFSCNKKERKKEQGNDSVIIPYHWLSGESFPWASYQIRKIAGCACAGNAGNVFPTRRLQSKPLVSDPDMHHGTCVTHVPWCMSGSLTCGGGENVPGIPSACAPASLRIWQEAHWHTGPIVPDAQVSCQREVPAAN